jgi:antitoxin ParD1/3/4
MKMTIGPFQQGVTVSYYLVRGSSKEDRIMPSPEKRTFSLPSEQAGYIDTLVASGTYASGSEVVRAGLRALQERDAAVEKWLREEVVGVYDAMQADPSRAISSDQVFATVRARHADRLRRKPRDP